MVSKKLAAIAASIIVGLGFLTAGTMISKKYMAKCRYKKQCDAQMKVFQDLSQYLDCQPGFSREDHQKAYCLIKGHYQKGGDPALTFEEKERWINGQDRYYDKKSCFYKEIIDKNPCPVPGRGRKNRR